MNKLNRLLFGLLVVGSLGLSAFTMVEERVNFGGTWVLNAGQSEVAGAAISSKGKSTVKVLSQHPMLILEKSITDSLGKLHSGTDTLVFGKAQQFNSAEGQVISRVMKQEWSADQQVMKLCSSYTLKGEGEQVEFSGTESWQLSDGGKTLTILNETVFPDRTDVVKLVYTKQ